MLNPAEADAVAARFGVALAQVRRDHLISHLLAALAALVGDQVVFFGGTALARTLVPDGRLSEDIDLLARASRSSVATTIQRGLVRLLRREYPGLSWEPELTAVRDTEPAVLRAPEGTTVRVQLLNAADYEPWPVTSTDLTQRYTDAAPARLLVPTPAAFAAWKTVTWLDRRASRDLYDLWSLARLGHIDAHAAELFTHHGPTNRPPAPWMFDKPPAESDWRLDLASQTHLEVTANQALTHVRSAWCPTGSQRLGVESALHHCQPHRHVAVPFDSQPASTGQVRSGQRPRGSCGRRTSAQRAARIQPARPRCLAAPRTGWPRTCRLAGHVATGTASMGAAGGADPAYSAPPTPVTAPRLS